MPIYALGDLTPSLPDDTTYWIAPGAQVIGNVTMAEDVSIWFNAVLRGDNEPITIGRGSNVQDGAVFHVDPGFPLTVGEDVTVGHMALLHGCTIGDNTLVGMGAMVMNGAKVGKNCLIGANAMVTEGKEIPDGSMVLGAPGKIVKTLDDAAIAGIARAAEAYRIRYNQYLPGLRKL
jgi:carbonic anhydrase/acetyltransferase-like protein (isoleucine patch superfamily)